MLIEFPLRQTFLVKSKCESEIKELINALAICHSEISFKFSTSCGTAIDIPKVKSVKNELPSSLQTFKYIYNRTNNHSEDHEWIKVNFHDEQQSIQGFYQVAPLRFKVI